MPNDLDKQKQQLAAESMRGAFGGQSAEPQPGYDWRGLLELINPFGDGLGDRISENLQKKPR